MRPHTLFLGVDGGASKTITVVVDAVGQECGRHATGGTNYAVIGLDQAVTRVWGAAAEAVRTAGGVLPVSAAWLGLAGIDRPQDQEVLLPRLRGLAEVVHLTNDGELALSALDGAVGVALVAGTGSIAVGRDPHGASARVGGWGHIIGDEGSGYDMGRMALQAVARAIDGRGPATTLLRAITEHWELKAPSDILGRVYPQGDKAAIARLSSLVLREARAGDSVGRSLVDRAADELALAATAAGDALNFPEGELALALTGGLLTHEPDFRAKVLSAIRQRRPVGQVAVIEEPALSAARGAIRLSQPDS